MDFFTKHSTANNSLLKIIATFVFIALPILGFFAGMHYQSLTEASNKASIIPPQIPSVARVVNDAATWKTYTNTKYGYSINYPSNWIMREFSDGKTGAAFQPANKPVDPENETLTINVSQKVVSEPVLSFEAYARVAGSKEIQSYGDAASFEMINTDTGLNGYKATWFMGTPSVHGVPTVPSERTASGPFTYFEIPNNSKQLLQFRGDLGMDLNVYEQMLKTIKFTAAK